MVTTTQKAPATGQQGFTLVELAIVLVIVGLLIGGILKGQELIASTRVTSTASQIKGIETAMGAFGDTYNAVPGDMTNVDTRLPNCATANSVCMMTAAAPGGGNGDGVIGNTFGTAVAVTQEGNAFFAHLAAADLLNGVDPTAIAATAAAKGIMVSPIAQTVSYRAASLPTAAALHTSPAALVQQAGTYLMLANQTVAIAAATNVEGNGMQPKAAQKIDAKIDDGNPNTGSTYGFGDLGAVTATRGCSSGAAVNATYNTQNVENDCALYIRINQ